MDIVWSKCNAVSFGHKRTRIGGRSRYKERVVEQDRNFAIGRALRVLELLAPAAKGIRLTDIAAQLGVNKAIAFRTLGALLQAGYVVKDAETERYLATMKLASLGLRRLDVANLDEWAQGLLDVLADTTHELVRLAVAEGETLRWIAKAQGSNSRLIVDPVSGADVILHATASGKAWLSTLDDDAVVSIVKRRGLQPVTARTGTDLGALLDELRTVRLKGYATVLEEMDEGINAIAAPITSGSNGSRKCVGTVSVAGPASRMTTEVLESFVRPLVDTAAALSDQWMVYMRHASAAVISHDRG